MCRVFKLIFTLYREYLSALRQLHLWPYIYSFLSLELQYWWMLTFTIAERWLPKNTFHTGTESLSTACVHSENTYSIIHFYFCRYSSVFEFLLQQTILEMGNHAWPIKLTLFPQQSIKSFLSEIDALWFESTRIKNER